MGGQNTVIQQVNCLAGIRRDGTQLDTNYYNDGKWMRFYRGKPRKMGGMYRGGTDLAGPSRSVYVSYNPTTNQNYLHNFTTTNLQRAQLDAAGNVSSIIDRTPAAGFTPNLAVQWTHDTMFDISGGTGTRLIAHASMPNTISDETAYPVFSGYLNTTTPGEYPLTSTGLSVSGGVVVLQPYLFAYGSNGLIQNGPAGNPTTWTGGESNAANVAGSKIVKGLSMRGSGQSPAGLFWSRESLIRVSFIGGTALWKYDTLTNQVSIMSGNSAIEFDGVYYWLGTDRFYMSNGSQASELPNQLNLNWFFDNLNWDYRHRVWAMKFPRWGELWWFFPSGASTECDKAIIFNIREKTWYDAAVTRSAGHSSPTYRYPILADPTQIPSSQWGVWAHEKGLDEVDRGVTSAIESYFETADFGMPEGGPQDQPQGPNFWTRAVRIEPDFNQQGQMEVVVHGSNYANGTQVDSVAYPFGASDTKVDMREQRRLIRLRFRSAAVGGFYELGKTLLTLEKGDVRG